MVKYFLSAAVLTATLSSAAYAAPVPVFSDSFNYGPDLALNAQDSVFAGNWVTTDGTVDYLSPPPAQFSELCRSTAGCVDLDGSTGDAGVFSTVQSFAAGWYTLAIELFGNGRGAAADDVTITLGSWTTTLANILSGADASKSFVFHTDGGVLSFANSGGDNQGAVLSSVSLAAVPVPAAGLMLMAGLAGLGVLRRRKTTLAV